MSQPEDPLSTRAARLLEIRQRAKVYYTGQPSLMRSMVRCFRPSRYEPQFSAAAADVLWLLDELDAADRAATLEANLKTNTSMLPAHGFGGHAVPGGDD